MQFDIFLSICQAKVDGVIPDETTMFRNFFDQVELADELGFGTAWVAESHLSSEIQKDNERPVVPHFEGEIGLNTDILQLAHQVFVRTKNLNIGSAIRNILCNGGPMAHAEAIRTFLTYHGLKEGESRKLELGFASGRFEFSNRPYGIVPRNAWEVEAWPQVKNLIFQEATEIFLRFLKGESFSSKDVTPKVLRPQHFRHPDDWDAVQKAFGARTEAIPLEPIWKFEEVGLIPKESPMHLLNLTIGSHDPKVQVMANKILPCGVFNLSITPSKTIEETHERMAKAYHPDGGGWTRAHMPRTVLVYVDKDRTVAQDRCKKAIETYWKAIQGTLDPVKVEQAVNNALVGTPEEVAAQVRERFHPEDRIMLWFDLSNHNNDEVKSGMQLFMQEVVPCLD